MWNGQDQNGFQQAVHDGIGQIMLDKLLGRCIQKYAENEEYKTFLEVGTWNGLGTTKVVVDSLRKRKDQGDYVFYSLECNSEKSETARKFYTGVENVHILNEVLAAPSEEEIAGVFPETRYNGVFTEWNNVDNANIYRSRKFMERPNLPDTFDVVVLDGGEFTTYFDYQAIKERCKVLLLDDTLSTKCKKIVEMLHSDPSWRIVVESREGNGCVVAEKIFEEPKHTSAPVTTATANDIPVVIHHEGGTHDYFVNSVKVNARRNKVIVIGDDANSALFGDMANVEHVHVNTLKSAEMDEFNQCFVNYSFWNSANFERKCFLRTFYVKELMKHRGLARVFYVDSDCVVLVNVTELFAKLPGIRGGYSVQTHSQMENPHHMVACIHNSLLTLDMCEEYVKLCFDVYKTGEKFHLIEDKWKYHKQQQLGGICDMTLWYLHYVHRLSRSESVVNFNDMMRVDGEDCVFDHNVNDAYGYTGTTTYRMGSNEQVNPWGDTKVITKRNDKYYAMSRDGREVRLLSIHYQGGAKGALAKNVHELLCA